MAKQKPIIITAPPATLVETAKALGLSRKHTNSVLAIIKLPPISFKEWKADGHL